MLDAASPAPQPAPTAGPPDKSTTVSVGKIAPSIQNDVMQKLLEACGPVKRYVSKLRSPTESSQHKVDEQPVFMLCLPSSDGVFLHMQLEESRGSGDPPAQRLWVL
jgi:hypothetical protein